MTKKDPTKIWGKPFCVEDRTKERAQGKNGLPVLIENRSGPEPRGQSRQSNEVGELQGARSISSWRELLVGKALPSGTQRTEGEGGGCKGLAFPKCIFHWPGAVGWFLQTTVCSAGPHITV